MLQDCDLFTPVIDALKADPTIGFGAKVELLGRVDGQFSTVQRVRIQTPARSVTVYAKILKPYNQTADEVARACRMLRREYDATSALYQALRQDAEIGAVRPVALLEAHRALVTEEVPGRPLSDVLGEANQATEALLAVARRIGAWTRIYQSLANTQGAVVLSERRTYLEDRLRQLEGRVITAAEREAVLAKFDALAAQLRTSTLATVPIHADLTPMNVIVDATGRIAVLDFTMAKVGTALHDLSHIYFHFEMMGARQRKREMMRDLQRALLAGYSPALSDHDPLFRLMLMQHVVCHVAQLAGRRVPIVDVLYRWFLRRRWQACERMFLSETSTLRAA